ncbi:MAG: ABC transporter substrate-binding protein, partial [Thermotogota bacterium]
MKKLLLMMVLSVFLVASSFADWDFAIQQDGKDIPVKEYNRIVSLSPAAVEVIYMIGAQEKLAAIATTRSGIWPEEKTSKLESVGSLTRPSIEKIIAYEPDLVLLNSMNTDVAAVLEEHGITYLYFRTDSIEKLLKELPLFGIMVGQSEAAIHLSHEKFEKLSQVKSELAERPLELKGTFLYS